MSTQPADLLRDSGADAERWIGAQIAYLMTPRDEVGLRERAIASLVDYQVPAGVEGLFVLGTVGEGPLLPRLSESVRASWSLTQRRPSSDHRSLRGCRYAAEYRSSKARPGGRRECYSGNRSLLLLV